MQDYLLVLLYSKLPVRNDFADMKVIAKKECNNKTKEGDQQNYLVMAQPTPFFCLNAYKTARKYEQQRIPLDSELARVVCTWLRHNKTGWFLLAAPSKQDSGPISSNGITNALNKISQNKLGKRVSTSLLRHSY